MRRHQRQIDVAAFLDRLAAVHRLEHGQFARFLLDQPRDAIKEFAALASGHFAPDILVSAPRRFHREIDVARVRLRDLGEFFFRGGIDRSEIFPRARRDEFSADEQLIARLELDVIVRFRRGRVTPFLAEIQMTRAERNSDAPIERLLLIKDNDGGSTEIFRGMAGVETITFCHSWMNLATPD